MAGTRWCDTLCLSSRKCADAPKEDIWNWRTWVQSSCTLQVMLTRIFKPLVNFNSTEQVLDSYRDPQNACQFHSYSSQPLYPHLDCLQGRDGNSVVEHRVARVQSIEFTSKRQRKVPKTETAERLWVCVNDAGVGEPMVGDGSDLYSWEVQSYQTLVLTWNVANAP